MTDDDIKFPEITKIKVYTLMLYITLLGFIVLLFSMASLVADYNLLVDKIDGCFCFG